MHRDLKPENLLLDKNKNIKIVDFGLSNLYRSNEMLKTACGSPCYAAPEMIAGKKYVGLRVDIWSAGVILYAMICGYLPFDDPDTQLLYRKIMSGDYTIPSHVSPEGRKLLECILNIDPERRYTIEQIRNHPWYKLYTPKEPQGIIVGQHKIPIDETILQQVPQYGYDVEDVRKNLNNNKHNKMTTLYYLLLLKATKGGYLSPADINSPGFSPEFIESKKPEPAREPSVERGQQGRSESVPKQRIGDRETSETRIANAERQRDDSLTPTKGKGDFNIGSKIADPRKSENRPISDLMNSSKNVQNKSLVESKPKTSATSNTRAGNVTLDEAQLTGAGSSQKVKSPKVSASPVPRRDDLIDRHIERQKTTPDAGTSMDFDNSSPVGPAKKALFNKIRDINETASRDRKPDPLVDSRHDKNRSMNVGNPPASYENRSVERRSQAAPSTPQQNQPSLILKESFRRKTWTNDRK